MHNIRKKIVITTILFFIGIVLSLFINGLRNQDNHEGYINITNKNVLILRRNLSINVIN
jgi:cbb3-type cytochrome oxidase subunit 3